MSITNDFVPFCSQDTGTNLEEQAAYLADPQLLIGNQTGIARSALVNKALRQATYIASLTAQYVGNVTNTNILDNAEPVNCLAQFTAALTLLPPFAENFLSGSGTWNAKYVFFILSGNATTGATYTNNSITFTVINTISAGLQLIASGSGAPSTSGILTKASGTGDATITFLAVRAPIALRQRMVGDGGGGSGSGTTSAGSGTDGSGTTFGSNTCGGGIGGAWATAGPGGAGGVPTLSMGSGISVAGAYGGGIQYAAPGGTFSSGMGGNSALGGGGCPVGSNQQTGNAGITNTGGGGSGASATNVANNYNGEGGGSGAWQDVLITSPASSYSYSVGAGGAGGSAGTLGGIGGQGGSGGIWLEAIY